MSAVDFPAFVCAVFAAGLAFGLGILLGARTGWRRQGRSVGAQLRALEDGLESIGRRVGELEPRMADVELHSGMLVPPQPPQSGLNLSRRAQALRLARQGQAAEQVAAALAIPRGEIELLLKVQRMSSGKPAGATGGL